MPAVSYNQTVLQHLSERSPFAVTTALTTLLDILYTTGLDGTRAYHNFRHLDEISESYVEVARDIGWQQPNEVFAALLLHDAVYVPCHGDNEERSAMLARRVLPFLVPPSTQVTLDLEVVANLILLTAYHGQLNSDDLTRDTQLFLDCDMAILGSDKQRFSDYSRAIAREYASSTSPELFAAGRRAFLEALIAPGRRIYLSDYFFHRLEEKAQANIRAYLAQ